MYFQGPREFVGMVPQKFTNIADIGDSRVCYDLVLKFKQLKYCVGLMSITIVSLHRKQQPVWLLSENTEV